jgi:hypothetical protein
LGANFPDKSIRNIKRSTGRLRHVRKGKKEKGEEKERAKT